MESLRRRCWNREADESGFPYLSQMENTAEKVDAYLILNCPLDELAILQLIMENPNITQKEIAIRIEKSERTVKNKVASLKEKGYIQRLNGKRSGKWEVLI